MRTLVVINRFLPVATFVVATIVLGTVASAQFFQASMTALSARPWAARAPDAGHLMGGSWFGDNKTETVITVRKPRKRPRFAAAGHQAYCVRACDGFYFPVGQSRAGLGPDREQQVCSSLCPGAKVSVYRTTGTGKIEQALSVKGEQYAKLPVAFRFRKEVAPSCSCLKNPSEGLAHLPITEDETLRRGDIVVTKRGTKVFRGSPTFPYSERDFVAAQTFGRMPRATAERVRQIDTYIVDRGDVSRTIGVAQRARLNANAQIRTFEKRIKPETIRVIDLSATREATKVSSALPTKRAL